jgi:hypothetical protein
MSEQLFSNMNKQMRKSGDNQNLPAFQTTQLTSDTAKSVTLIREPQS